MKNLYNLREECSNKLLKEYDKFLYNQRETLVKIPKLYYISNGKGGWLGGVDSFIKKNILPIKYDTNGVVVSLKNFKIYHISYSGDLKRPMPSHVFSIDPKDLYFDALLERLENQVYNEENSEVSQTLPLKEWLEKALNIGLDITFEDTLLHYKGVTRKYITPYCKDEYQFEKFKNKLIVGMAKKSLNSSKTPSYF